MFHEASTRLSTVLKYPFIYTQKRINLQIISTTTNQNTQSFCQIHFPNFGPWCSWTSLSNDNVMSKWNVLINCSHVSAIWWIFSLFTWICFLFTSASVGIWIVLCPKISLNNKSHSESYRRLYPTVPRKYLSTCFAAIHWIYLDSRMTWIRAFTTKQISSIVFVIHQGPNQLAIHSGIDQIWIWSRISQLIQICIHRSSYGPTIQRYEFFRKYIVYFPWPRKISFFLCHTSNPKN